MISIIIGAVVVAGTAFLYERQVKTERFYAKTRIDEYERAFAKGFEAQNGHKPYVEEEKTVEIVEKQEEEDEWQLSDERADSTTYERWDD